MSGPEPVPSAHPDAPAQGRRSAVVDWITEATRRDRTIISAIPPLYARYATVVIPDDEHAKQRADAALVEILQAQESAPTWWLGYLDTGVADVVRPAEIRASIYVGWPYVLMQGGAEEALTARSIKNTTPWHSALPELLFPLDHSWLVSTMWDDDWRCIGGPASLVDAILGEPALEARSVMPNEEATPPGHDEG